MILASASRARKGLLESLGINFEIIPADIDEKAIRHPHHPGEMAAMIAEAKAQKVESTNSGIIIAADTFEVIDRIVLEKPKDLAEAREMLERKSRKTVTQVTGFCFMDTDQKFTYVKSYITVASYRNLPSDEIDWYINNFPVLDWSGAFDPIQFYCSSMLDRISGDLSAFYGLPLNELVDLLRNSGVDVKPKFQG